MIQEISWYQTGTNQWVSQMWIWLLIAINVFFLSVQNVEDTDLWGYFFCHITLICVLCQRIQIWGNIYFGGHRSEYDVRGHRPEEICFWKDIDLGVTSEDTDLRRQTLEGHRSEYDVMIGHGSESYIFVTTEYTECIWHPTVVKSTLTKLGCYS
jgi:hypothetical protein